MNGLFPGKGWELTLGIHGQVYNRARRPLGTKQMTGLPFLTAYDPPGSSEGALDPLGLYLIADRLATQLVPAVRERMQRIRFLTAMAVGCLVTEDVADGSSGEDISPYLVWEWMIIEAFDRTRRGSAEIWGVPGTLVASRAIDQFGYIDSRSYLKTARIFGFHGVYKRLAHHLGIVNVNLDPSVLTEALVNAWAKTLGNSRSKDQIRKWSNAVRSSMSAKPHAKTATGFKRADWEELASAFLPGECSGQERDFLRKILLVADKNRIGALPIMWQLQDRFTHETYCEEDLHTAVFDAASEFRPLLQAIKAYEAFARRLQDSFDLLRAEASKQDRIGFPIAAIAKDSDFISSMSDLDHYFAEAFQKLGNLDSLGTLLQNQFADRFKRFADKQSPEACAHQLCEHHAEIQKSKSEQGKRTWFDKLDSDRIYIRYPYRIRRQELKLEKYLHDYRAWPIRNFWGDLNVSSA